jgi:LysR family transcriptional regulator for bpeEF and oprC
MDQLAAMRAFARVVEVGSFTRAADALDMPKATLTKLIQGLESHLRTQLLHRTTRRVNVTPDGAAYYERAMRLLADLDELDGGMTQSQTSPSGRLRVDVSAAVARLCIVPALHSFQKRYPDIRIDLGVTDRAVDMIAENVDCVIRAGPLKDQALIARRIAMLEFATCASPAYIERHGEPAHPTDLETTHFVVGYFSTRTHRPYPFSFGLRGERYEFPGRSLIAVNDGNAYVAAGLAGLGVVQAPRFMMRHELASGALRPVLTEWAADPLPLYVVYPPNTHLSNRLRVFVDWAADLFATDETLSRRSARSA